MLQRPLLALHSILVSWAPECSMHVTVGEQTSSGGHKVVVASLVVSHDISDAEHASSIFSTDAPGSFGRRLLYSASGF